MRVSKNALVTLLALSLQSPSSAFIPSSRIRIRPSTTAQNSKTNRDEPEQILRTLAGGAATFLLGFGLSGQVAFANPTIDPPSAGKQLTEVSFGSDWIVAGGAPVIGDSKFESLDFSMPSYSGSASSSSPTAPVFSNPFGDDAESRPSESDKQAEAVSKASEEKAEEKKRVAEEKVEEKKRVAEEKAEEKKRLAEEKKRLAEEKEAGKEQAVAEKKGQGGSREEKAAGGGAERTGKRSCREGGGL